MRVKGVRCKKCGEAIYSRYVHDFHWCHCDSVAIDGGSIYVGVENPNSYMKITGEPENYEFVEIEIGDEGFRDTLVNDWNRQFDEYGWEKDPTKIFVTKFDVEDQPDPIPEVIDEV